MNGWKDMASNDRKELMINLYNQLWNSINVRTTAIWKSVGLFTGAFAVLALTGNNILSLDIAASLINMICGWYLANIIDAAFWFNRNLVIIANIEKEFFEKDDLKRIHPYFGRHRPENKMIYHFKVQFTLGIGIASIFLILHFVKEVLPNVDFDIDKIHLLGYMPYLITLCVCIYLIKFKKRSDKNYISFVNSAPGIDVDSSGIEYDEQHGFMKNSSKK